MDPFFVTIITYNLILYNVISAYDFNHVDRIA